MVYVDFSQGKLGKKGLNKREFNPKMYLVMRNVSSPLLYEAGHCSWCVHLISALDSFALNRTPAGHPEPCCK